MFSYSHCPSPFPNFFNSCTTHDCLVFMSLLQYTTQFCFLQTLLPVFTPQIVFQEFLVHLIYFRGTRSRSWLRHYATIRMVAGSIPDGVIGILHWHNPSGRTMALGLTQPLTEMSTRNISWGIRRPVRTADNLTTFMCRLSWNLGALTFWRRNYFFNFSTLCI